MDGSFAFKWDECVHQFLLFLSYQFNLLFEGWIRFRKIIFCCTFYTVFTIKKLTSPYIYCKIKHDFPTPPSPTNVNFKNEAIWAVIVKLCFLCNLAVFSCSTNELLFFEENKYSNLNKRKEQVQQLNFKWLNKCRKFLPIWLDFCLLACLFSSLKLSLMFVVKFWPCINFLLASSSSFLASNF